jgi:hypothetical protein
MTLKEKFDKNVRHDENGIESEVCVSIAEDFAIGFGEYLEILSNSDFGTLKYQIFEKFDVTTLLQIYKKEKGL